MNRVKRWLQALQRSLFLKVLGVLLVTAALLNTLLVITWRQGRMEQDKDRVGARRGELLVRHYVGYVLKDLGDPPNKAKALALAEKGLWSFRFLPGPHSKQAAWASSDDVPYPSELRSWMRGPDWGWRHGNFFELVEHDGDTLLLLAEPFKGVSLAWQWQLYLGLGVALLVTLAWLVVRWLLLPVKWLDSGMARVAEGELGYRVPTRQLDELGRLAEQFNAMSARVQTMLQQRQQMLLDVSHELRTPLTRMKLGLENLPEGEDRQSLAEDVTELESLVRELLEGARLEAGASPLKLERFDLVALLKELAEDFKARQPGLELSLPSALILSADPQRLRRLLQNLLNNAFVHGQPARGPVRLSLRTQPGQALLSVEDQGPGLGEADKSQLFSPFFRADRSRTRATGGLGLGLHLCRSIAKAHGGSLDAQAAEGGGLRLLLKLPLA